MVSVGKGELLTLVQSPAFFQLLVLAVAGKDDEFKELLARVALDKVDLSDSVNQLSKEAPR